MIKKTVRLSFRCMLNIALVGLFQSAGYGQAFQLEAIVDGTRHTLPSATFAETDDLAFISVDKLAEILNLQTYHSNNTRKAILYIGDIEVKVTALNPFVSIDDEMIQMPVSTHYRNHEVYVPTTHFLHLISPYLGNKPTLLKSLASTPTSAPAQPVVVAKTEPPPAPPQPEVKSSPYTRITDLQVEEKANGTLIRIKAEKALESSHINSRVTNGWLYVDIYKGSVNGLQVREDSIGEFIKEIVPVQLGQSAQLSFKINGEIASRKIYTDAAAHEVLVSLKTEERVSPDLLKTLESEKQKWLIDTIVIDPGHGGHDPGAIGPSKLYEKHVTLAIGLKLRDLFKDRSDIKVVMTRDDDRFIPLKDRTKLANQAQGKLFLSIHANSNRNSRVNGVTTYFLGQAKTEEALEVSRRENAVINYEKDTSLYSEFQNESFILLTLAQNAYQQESQDLAALVQAEVSKRISIRNRGVKQAGYYVLIGASMPNILVETAFISNRREEKLLKSGKFQQDIAEGIFASVMRFKELFEQGI